MDNFVMIDGKKYRLVPEETHEKPAKEEPVKKLTGYERAALGQEYFFVDMIANVHEYHENNSKYDNNIYAAGNYYTDKKLALDNVRADSLMRRLRRYAAMHGGIVTKNAQTKNGQKYYIGYTDTNGLIVDWYETNWHNLGLIYFFDKKTAQQALEEFRPELEWYFTEYEPQLL